MNSKCTTGNCLMSVWPNVAARNRHDHSDLIWVRRALANWLQFAMWLIITDSLKSYKGDGVHALTSKKDWLEQPVVLVLKIEVSWVPYCGDHFSATTLYRQYWAHGMQYYAFGCNKQKKLVGARNGKRGQQRQWRWRIRNKKVFRYVRF